MFLSDCDFSLFKHKVILTNDPNAHTKNHWSLSYNSLVN